MIVFLEDRYSWLESAQQFGVYLPWRVRNRTIAACSGHSWKESTNNEPIFPFGR